MKLLLVLLVSFNKLLTIVDADLKWLGPSNPFRGALVGAVAIYLLKKFQLIYRIIKCGKLI